LDTPSYLPDVQLVAQAYQSNSKSSALTYYTTNKNRMYEGNSI